MYTLFLATEVNLIKENIESIVLFDAYTIFLLIISSLTFLIVVIITVGITMEMSYFVIKPLQTLLLRLS